MIIRLTKKLSDKIKEKSLQFKDFSGNPFIDWSGNLFTSGRVQYIIMTNSSSLLSTVFYGKGVTDGNLFIKKTLESIKYLLEDYKLELIYHKIIALETNPIHFSSIKNRSILGSMNDLINQAKYLLKAGDKNLFEVSLSINKTPMGYLKYKYPIEVFREFGSQIEKLRL